MSNGEPVIRLENICQHFRVIHERPDTLRELFARVFRNRTSFHDFEAVRNVSFEIGRGQAVGIIGRNGSGKSTLLKIIAGVYRPTRGKVEVRGSLAPLIELGAGFHHELTGRENILLSGLLMGYSKKEMLARQERIIEFADIGEFIDAPIKQYSSGMYMRLAFAVATEVDPQILVVDEILAVGDAGFREKCFQRIHSFREAGKTILLVTHDMEDVRQHCERVMVMEQGSVIADSGPEEAIAVYKSLLLPEVVGAH
ncbi:MAG TPA: ABC transporter ATP-binding protein [Candidatus Binatia bacterium]|nr:ABC transporter ATP-binding protein [Candidatus Binatia bacterium]